MLSRQTIIATVVIAAGTATAAGVTLGPGLFRGNTAAGPAPIGTEQEARRGQLARLARNPDIAPELVELLRDLQQNLQAQHAAQQALAAQLADLQRERRALTGVAAAEANPVAAGPDDASIATQTGAADPTRSAWFQRRRGPVTEERLLEAGFAAAQARELVGRADALAMERLNLQYQAVREGWVDTDQYREALSDLPDLREVVTSEYGEDAYDRYLYASGRPNRLVVRDVLQDSPAGAAGLQPGDRVLAMDNERIYSTRDLMHIASTGSEGEAVALVVERGDTVFEVYVPRGPLGIRGGRAFEIPASAASP